MNSEELIKRLNIFSKNDIIKAVALYADECTAWNILYRLKDETWHKLHSAQRKAFDDAKTAIVNLANWQADMADRYGNGETVKIGNIPNKELRRGEKLELTVKEAFEIEEKIDKKINKLLKLYENKEAER